MNKKYALSLILIGIILLCIVPIRMVNASEDYWISKALLKVARGGLGAATVEGKIYAIGGSTESGKNAWPKNPNDIVGSNDEYDPTTNSWTPKTPMPTPRFNFAIATYQGKIYCIGGVTGYTTAGHPIFTTANEIYNPTTNTWQTITSAPTARSSGIANVVDNKIYIIGGNANFTLNEVYDPETDIWTTKSSVPYGVTYCSATLDEKIYCFIQEIDTPKLAIYNTKTDTWSLGSSPLANFNRGEAQATTGAFAAKRIYFLSSGAAANQIYDPQTDKWILGATVLPNRKDFAVAVINDTLYAIGGSISTPLTPIYPGDDDYIITQSSANKQYIPINYGTPDPTYQTPTPTTSPSLKPTPTPTVTISPSKSANPSSSASSSPSPQPTQTTQPTKSQTEPLYTITIIAATVIIISTIAIALKKRKK